MCLMRIYCFRLQAMSNRTFKGTPGGSSGYFNIESKMLLRDTVDQLRQELLHSRAETQRVSEKLSCMMLLVKRYTASKYCCLNYNKVLKMLDVN